LGTRELAERFGLKFTALEDGYQMHGVVTHLIDKSGNLRARYHGLKFNATNLIVHINALTNDYH
jgi:protein SCO1/2